MQALKSIPKVLSGIEDINRMASTEMQLAQYKKSVKKFIEALTQQVGQLIDNYETKIAALTKQNARLKQKPSPLKEAYIKKQKSRSPFKVEPQVASPIKLYKGLDEMHTAKSSMFTPQRTGSMQEAHRFSTVLAKYQTADGDNNFPLELINPEPAADDDARKSRFAVKNNQKKQREDQLRHFLQTGKKNLNSTTERLISAIGIQKKRQEDIPQFELKRDRSDSSLSRRSHSLNKSLGDLNKSLDASFHSKKARSKNKQKKQMEAGQAEKKRLRDQETSKMLKEKGIKSLLQRMRDNVENSSNRPTEVIKNSKLISCGSDSIKNTPASRSPRKDDSVPESPTLRGKRNSKVLINPVPVDIGRKSKLLKKESMNSPLSPERKPTSILKQSSLVLGQSLSGISAIDFN